MNASEEEGEGRTIDASSSSLRKENLYQIGTSRPTFVCLNRSQTIRRCSAAATRKGAHIAAVEETLELVQHLRELIQSDRFLLRDVGLILDLIKHTQQDLVSEASKRSVQRRRRHNGLVGVRE